MRNGKFIILGIIAVAGIVTTLGGNKANAANGWDIPLNGPSTTTSQTTSSVSLSLSSGTIQTDLDAANATTNPDEAGKVLSQTATITVGNTDGYTVYVSGNTNLTGKNNTSHKIPSITSSKTLGSMSNEWGYYGVLGDSEASFNPGTSFKAMTTSQQSVGTGGATSSSVTKKLTLFYGARVNSSAAEDFYGNEVTLSVVAQPRTVTTTVTKFNGITTMQQMTKEICAAADVNDTVFLEDERDRVNGVAGTGTHYWVTKMLGSTPTAKDGGCWMSQNLALNIEGSVTASNGDGTTFNWTGGHMATGVNQSGLNNTTSTYAWNLGDYVIINPTGTTACSNNNTGLSACAGQFVAVENRTPSSDPNFYKETEYTGTDGSTCTKTANTTYSTATSGACAQYDAHYLAGNYYQWNAATAGTGGSITNANASGSICPKNWKLPNANSDAKGTFKYLLTQYGVQSNVNIAAGAVASPVNGNDYDIALSPLFFVRGGYVTPGNYLNYAGQNGYYWSSRAYSITDQAYALGFGSSSVYPSSNSTRYYGRSLRCLIPTTQP